MRKSVVEIVAIIIVMTCLASAEGRDYSPYDECVASCGLNSCDYPSSQPMHPDCSTLCDQQCSIYIGPGDHH